MSKDPLRDLDTKTLLVTRTFLNGKNLVWQMIGSVQTYYAVVGFMTGGLWYVWGGLAVLSAYIIRETPTQITLIEEELNRRGHEDR